MIKVFKHESRFWSGRWRASRALLAGLVVGAMGALVAPALADPLNPLDFSSVGKVTPASGAYSINTGSSSRWNQWRGPLGTGVAYDAKPPVEWSSTKNIRWRTELPGKGHSSPVLGDDHVFVTAAIPVGPKLSPRMSGRPGEHDNLPIDSKYQFVVIAVDRRDGAILWKKVVREEVPLEAGHFTGSLASASPVTDGEFVFAYFGAQGVYCLNLQGDVVWERHFGPMHTKHGHGHGASPTLYGDSLIVNWDHEDGSFLVVMDKRTGKNRWRKERSEDTSWSSPIVIEHKDGNGVVRPQIVVCGTDRVRGFDLDSGEILWECGGMSSNVVATPVYANGMLYAGSSYEKKILIAINLQGAQGDLTGTKHVAWTRTRGTPYVPSMLLYDDFLYFLSHYQNVMTRVHGPSGEDQPGRLRLDELENIYASPVAANGHVYVTDLSGTTVVLSHEQTPKTVAVNRLDESISASAAIEGDEIFLRGEKHLFCIGQDKSPGARPVQGPTPAPPADPMARFARMVGGEWNGTSGFDSWTWGPGKHSGRVMTDGFGAGGNPWRGLGVVYWHPGRMQLCSLSLNPYEGSVSEDTITVKGETSETVSDLHQNGVHRKMVSRTTFDGPHKYHAALQEEVEPGKLTPLAEWDYFRSRTLTPVRPIPADKSPEFPNRLKAFEPLLGYTWNAKGQVKGDWGRNTQDAFHIETTFEWVPLANAIYARTFALRGNGTPMHLLDTYFYHHTGTDRLRCLALSKWGDWPEAVSGVYEGDVTLKEDGALQIDLKGYEGERRVSYMVQFDFEKAGTLHHRIWSSEGAERTPLLDIHHTASEMSKSIMVVFQDKKNNYWFGSDVQGVYRYDGNTITHFTTKDGLSDDQVRGIQEDTGGNLYFTTSNGICKFDGKTFSTLIPAKSDPPDKEWKLEPGDLWFPGAQDGGVVSRYDGKVLHGLEFPKTKLNDVYSIYKDSKGHVWFGAGTGKGAPGACRYDGKSFTWISSDELEFGDVAYCVRSIAEDKDGKFWFSNTKHRFDVSQNDVTGKENAANFRKEKGVSHSEDDFPYFMSSTKDNNGDLWMASFSAGVWRYDGEHMIHYPVQDGGRPVTLFSIYKDNQGDLWLGSHEAGAYKFNGKSFEKFLFRQRPSQPAPSRAVATPKDN